MKQPFDFFNTRTLHVFGIALLFCLPLNLAAQSQRPDKAFGIGFQAGNPTGLALQFYKAHGVSTDILLAYNLDDFLFLNIHGLWNTHLDQEQRFHLPDNDNEFEAGLSGDLGLNFVVGRVEFFGQITPRIALIPATNFNLGGGVGIRFFI
jgi:hypothetical protein